MTAKQTYTIPSDQRKLVEVDEYAGTIIAELGFNPDDSDNIAIAISEAVNNAILHGNRGDTSKSVHIKFVPVKDGLKIEVTDEGAGFNPEDVANPTEPENLMEESGRGLLIIRHLMDEVDIKHTPKGTRVRMVKYHS